MKMMIVGIGCDGPEGGGSDGVVDGPDGSVAAHVEGDSSAVDAFVRWCHDGPSMAYVEHVDVRPADDQGLTSFRVTG